MGANIVFSVIILIILVSLQYTLNLMLREIKDIRKILSRLTNYTDIGLRGENDFGRNDWKNSFH